MDLDWTCNQNAIQCNSKDSIKMDTKYGWTQTRSTKGDMEKIIRTKNEGQWIDFGRGLLNTWRETGGVAISCASRMCHRARSTFEGNTAVKCLHFHINDNMHSIFSLFSYHMPLQHIFKTRIPFSIKNTP